MGSAMSVFAIFTESGLSVKCDQICQNATDARREKRDLVAMGFASHEIIIAEFDSEYDACNVADMVRDDVRNVSARAKLARARKAYVVDIVEMRAESAALESASAAYAAGKAAAETMMHVGQVFVGSMGVADALGYTRGTREYQCATLGATFVIAAYGEVWTNVETGKLVSAPVRV